MRAKRLSLERQIRGIQMDFLCLNWKIADYPLYEMCVRVCVSETIENGLVFFAEF